MRLPLKTVLATAALGLAVAGCQSKAEEEVNKQADAIGESYDAEAKLVEARAENAPDEKQAKEKAEALRAQGDKIEKDLKEHAKKDLD